MLITNLNKCSSWVLFLYRQQIVKVLLVSVMGFTVPNLYAQEGSSNQNPGEASDPSESTNVAATPRTEAEKKNRGRLLSIRQITRFMDMGSTGNIENMIKRHLTRYPDDPLAYGQLARSIMKLGYVSDDSLLGYRYTKEANDSALDALIKALMLDPKNADEFNRLGHLHAVQGRYEEAELAFKKVRQLNKTPAWLNFNEAILHIGRKDYSKAATSLQPLTSIRPADKSNIAWNIYRAAWDLRTAMALAHPETDPVTSVSSGAMIRIPINTLYDEARRSPASDKPTIIFVSSSDTGCPGCITDLTLMDEAAEALGDSYELIYTSVEPWNDISKHSIGIRAFTIKGVPTQILMYKGQHLVTAAGALSAKKIQSYKDAAPKIISGVHKTKKLKPYDELLKIDIRAKIYAAINKKAKYSAAAVVVEGRNWASGVVGGGETQAQANDDALARCNRNAKARGITSACRMYSVSR